MNGVDCLEKMDFLKSRDTLVLFSSGPSTGKDAEIACEGSGAKFQLSNPNKTLILPVFRAELKQFI